MLLFLSCRKGLDAQKEDRLLFSPDWARSKAMLDPVTFRAEGNRLKVFDVAVVNAEETLHIDDYVVSSGEHVWDYLSGNSYFWRGTSHKFFGWYSYDKAMDMTADAFFGEPLSLGSDRRTLEIPEYAFTPSSPAFDFLYSDVVIRDHSGTVKDKSVIPLQFSHLFTGMSIGLLNRMETPVTLNRFCLEGLCNSGSATITFADVTEVEYGSVTKTSDEVFKTAAGYTLEAETGTVKNIFTGSTTVQKYYMLWPLSKDVLSPTTEASDKSDGREYEASDSLMVIDYTLDGFNFRKRLKFPAIAFEAGKRYHLDLIFADRMIELVCKVNPWTYNDVDIDFADQTVTVKESGVLHWDPSTCAIDETNKVVYVTKGKPVEAEFAIDAPTGGSWMVSLEGDFQAFELEPSSGVIDGSFQRVSLTPLITNPDRDYSVTLKFAIRTSDGRVIAADDMVQDRDGDNMADIYSVILQKTN